MKDTTKSDQSYSSGMDYYAILSLINEFSLSPEQVKEYEKLLNNPPQNTPQKP
jgi:hypothetical protein